jgi:hypothetical protein
MWRQMGISEVMSDVVMADIRSQTETAKRLATSVRAQNTPAPSSPPELLVRQPSLGDMNVGRPPGSPDEQRCLLQRSWQYPCIDGQPEETKKDRKG